MGIFYFLYFSFLGAYLRAENFEILGKLGKIEKINLLVIVYRVNGWGCGNQTFFGKRHTLTLLPKKFSWKTDKLILGPHLFEISLYFASVRNFCHFYNTPTAVQSAQMKKFFSRFVKQGKGFHLIYACWGLGCTPKRQKSKMWENLPKYSNAQSWNNPSQMFSLCNISIFITENMSLT